jgi:pilus assembly protein CpaB
MLLRNIVLALGALLVFAGIALAMFWLSQMGRQPAEVKKEPQRPVVIRQEALLEAVHPLPAGTLIRPGDFRWHEIDPSEVQPGMILRKDTSGNEYLGAVVRKDFAAGEALTSADLLKTADRRFLSAVLEAGKRAATIAVDAVQSSSGMILPGDHVDVVLTQNLSGVSSDPTHKTVAETVLSDVRVIAVDQRLKLPLEKPALLETASETKKSAQKEPRMPRTVTLELSEAQAEKLFVAAQLGGLQLPVRSLEGTREKATPGAGGSKPTWAFDVSPALSQIPRQKQAQAASENTIEKCCARKPPRVD